MGRPRSDRQISRVSVSFDADDYQALRDLADENDVSAAWIVRRAVAAFLKEQGGRVSVLTQERRAL